MFRPALQRHQRLLSFSLAVSLAVAAGLGALGGCKRGDKPAQSKALPSLRIYALGGPAGAIEPCGCVKDMLGGVDHVAGFIASQKAKAPASFIVGAGPIFFEGRAVPTAGRDQALFKAETLAASLHDAGLVAWAPGANDFALGVEKFAVLQKATGARALAANFGAAAPTTATAVVEQGGMRVGLVGISLPTWVGPAPAELVVADAEQALTRGRDELRKNGAQLLIALIAAPRGDALRLAERVTGFQLVVLGKGFDEGENNDTPFPPELLGQSLVVQAPNHLQGVGVVDLFVREGSYEFADGSGVAALGELQSLQQRQSELRRRIANWERPGSSVKPDELSARKRDLVALDEKLKSMSQAAVPAQGSYLLYDFTEVRESLGVEGRVSARLEAYYQRVNEHNRVAFADKLPVPVAAGEPRYVGIETCSNCHQEERKFWDTTSHAKAYATLSTAHKEFNLDCVGCHVTGYEKAGGSTVTHVEGLRDVQCEVCHGPGSNHAERPLDKTAIRRTPDIDSCSSACHHPPHVNADWNVGLAWSKIIGPGHGR